MGAVVRHSMVGCIMDKPAFRSRLGLCWYPERPGHDWLHCPSNEPLDRVSGSGAAADRCCGKRTCATSPVTKHLISFAMWLRTERPGVGAVAGRVQSVQATV